MINLLPSKEKQGLLFQKYRNLIIVLGSMVIIFLICLSLVLLSLKFYILQRVSYEKYILEETEKSYQTADFSSLLDSIKKNNISLSKIDSFYKKESYLSNALKTILDIKRSGGISFNDIVLNHPETNGVIKVSIYGTSISRDELLSFKENIDSQKEIKNVNLPPENLIKPSNASFYVTFEIDP